MAVRKMRGLPVAMGLLLVLLLFFAACSRRPPESGPPVPSPLPAPLPAPAAPGGVAGPRFVEEGAALPSAERLIVRSGHIALVVKDVSAALDDVSRLAEGLGGFVVSTSRQKEGETATISFRVPEARFAEAMRRLRALGVRVESESSSSQDVTEEYVDLQSRLRNLEATEKELLRLMEKATKVEEVMLVFRELANVRQQIEVTKGRMQYLERTAAMALISVELRPATSPEPVVRPGWSWLEVVKDALGGLASFGQRLASGATWLVIFIPVWVPALLILYWLIKRSRR